MEKTDEIINRMDEIKPILSRLNWDKDHNQLNPGKLSYMQSLEKEYEELKTKLQPINSEVLE